MTAFIVWHFVVFVLALLGLLVAYARLSELAGHQASRASRPLPLSTMDNVLRGGAAPGGWRWLLLFFGSQIALVWDFATVMGLL